MGTYPLIWGLPVAEQNQTQGQNSNLSPAARQLFTSMLEESGMPVTEAAMTAEWNRCNVAEGSQFTNDSQWSPFWRLITAIVTRPGLWLVKLLVEHALPNTFLRFAGGVWLDVFAWGVDVARKGSTAARGRVEFFRPEGSGGSDMGNSRGEVLIPAGTAVESPPLGEQGTVYRVITLADAVIPVGALSALVDVQAAEQGEAYNLGPGYYSILPKPVPGVEHARNNADWLESPGADVEEDDALRLRCRNQFAAVGQYHHDAAYRALIAAFAGIRVDYVFFEKDAPRGPGTANAHIMVESGVPPQELVDSLNAHIRESGNHGHGDDLRCMAIVPLPVDLAVLVYPPLAMDADKADALRRSVEDRVRCAFRENTDFAVTRVLPLARFSFSRLAEELHAQLPDLRSVEFTRPAAATEGGMPLLWDDIVPLRQLPVLGSFSTELRGGL